jgi:serine/threonine-protein kinase
MIQDLIRAAPAEPARLAGAIATATVPPRGAAASPAGLAPGDRVGDWTLERCVGAGGMGAVHAAVHAVIGKHAAIKLVRRELADDRRVADRFVLEARVVNRIGHPNVIDIFSIGWLSDHRPYLVMELLCGRTLAGRMSVAPVAHDEATEILLSLCDALTAAHAHGVVHRDLKPENVFLAATQAGRVVKLIDWGLAVCVTDPHADASASAPGTFVGTPRYASPEQARGHAVDCSADVYSLGVVAYELYLGRAPFVVEDPVEQIAMHLHVAPPPPHTQWRAVPPTLDQLLIAMLAKKPAARPGISEVRSVFQRLRGQLAAVPACVASPSPIDATATWDMPAASQRLRRTA